MARYPSKMVALASSSGMRAMQVRNFQMTVEDEVSGDDGAS